MWKCNVVKARVSAQQRTCIRQSALNLRLHMEVPTISDDSSNVPSYRPCIPNPNFLSVQDSIPLPPPHLPISHHHAPHTSLPLTSLAASPCARWPPHHSTALKEISAPDSDNQHALATMTHQLPPNLLALFAPRPALRFLPPADHAPEDRRTQPITGIASYLSALRDDPPVPYTPTESWLEKRDRLMREKKERREVLSGEGFKDAYKPHEDPAIRGDAFRTLFVARLTYDTEIRDLEKTFGRFGPIERIRIVTDTGESIPEGSRRKKGKGHSKGYAFVVFEREKDMKGTAIFPTPSRFAYQVDQVLM